MRVQLLMKVEEEAKEEEEDLSDRPFSFFLASRKKLNLFHPSTTFSNTRTAPLRAARAIRSSTSVAAAFAPTSSSSPLNFRRRAFSRSVRVMASSSDWAKEVNCFFLSSVFSSFVFFPPPQRNQRTEGRDRDGSDRQN